MPAHAHEHMDALCFGYGWMMTSLQEQQLHMLEEFKLSKCFHAILFSKSLWSETLRLSETDTKCAEMFKAHPDECNTYLLPYTVKKKNG